MICCSAVSIVQPVLSSFRWVSSSFVCCLMSLLLQLQGACKTCSSSSITLKNGVENMLRHYVPEVKEVVEVTDEVDAVNADQLAKLDAKLNEIQKD